jgi:hypothetical protein
MKLTPWYLAALAPIAIAGCSGALIGHVAVLALAIGIFVGTLSLGRAHASTDTTSHELTSQVQTKGVKTV